MQGPSSRVDLEQKVLLDSISKGLLVPVLGGEINLCGRPLESGVPIRCHGDDGLYYPPSTGELALDLLMAAQEQATGLDPYIRNLVKRFLEDGQSASQSSISDVDLANVCQYIQLMNPSGEILDALLPDILAAEYRPTAVHDFLVKLAQYEPAAGHPDNRPYPCIVTACFDQVLEQQLRKNNVPFHLVAFVLGNNGGVFEYTAPGDAPNTSRECDPKDFGKMMEAFREHAVVIKLNGGIDRSRNFAIREDDYIDYLSHRGVKELLPEILSAKLTKRGRIDGSHLLFLGYSLRHWNLRVILRRIWSECLENRGKRWTVLLEPGSDEIERKFWDEYGAEDIKQIGLPLADYMTRLTARLASLPSGASGRPLKKTGGNEAAVADTKPVRDGVFISYSHNDIQAFNELNKMLAPVCKELNIWHDNMIEPGAQWRAEIKRGLASAKAAILLVSPDFLVSDFIQKNELPPLLEAARADGCRILWIKLKECLVRRTAIEDYQALYSKALMNLTDNERNEALCGIAEKICDLLSDRAAAQS
jgi:hypothetical protein